MCIMSTTHGSSAQHQDATPVPEFTGKGITFAIAICLPTIHRLARQSRWAGA